MSSLNSRSFASRVPVKGWANPWPRLSAEGAKLVLAARSMDDLDALARRLEPAIAVQTDVRSVSELNGLVDAAVGWVGRLDVMINNCGLAVYGPFLETTEKTTSVMMATNVKGVYFRFASRPAGDEDATQRTHHQHLFHRK